MWVLKVCAIRNRVNCVCEVCVGVLSVWVCLNSVCVCVYSVCVCERCVGVCKVCVFASVRVMCLVCVKCE